MTKKSRAPALPLMFARLAVASWGTIMHRSVMIAQGTCSVAEYRRMVAEKLAASQSATTAALTGKGAAAMLSPYLDRARANHRRLASGAVARIVR